jgi:hypothetical protein
MTELTELLDITTNENGDIFMNGTQVRVLKGSPDMVAILDAFMALCKISYFAAKQRWFRLMKDFPEISNKIVTISFPGKSGAKSPGAAINDLVYIIGKLKGPVAALFAQKGADAWTRILGGDQTLHAEVDACREEQERLAVEDPSNPMRLFGKYIEDKTIGNLTVAQYAPIWKKKRDIQKTVTKQLNEAITTVGFKQPAYQIVSNYKNQAIFGFDGTTKAFKKDNAIKNEDSMAQYMTPMQLDLDKMMGFKIVTSIEETPSITKDQLFSMSRCVRDKTAEYAKFIGIQGLSDEQFGNKIHKLEVEERKMNKRVLLLEKKKQLAIEAKRPRSNPIASLFAKRAIVAV